MIPRHTPSVLPLLAALLSVFPAGPARSDSAETSATDSAETSDDSAETARLLSWLSGRGPDTGDAGVAADALRRLVRGTRVAAGLSTPAGIVDALFDSGVDLDRRPVRGEITSPFGVRRDPIRRKRRKHHNGLDFEATRGTLVRAAGPGIVVTARRAGGYGRVIYIDHGDGLETRYAHLQRLKVREGDYVPAGAAIGTVGSSGRATGPHLHFEVRVDGRPVEPSEFLGVGDEVEELRRDRPAL